MTYDLAHRGIIASVVRYGITRVLIGQNGCFFSLQGEFLWGEY
jgi:hypothetical protein